MDLVGYLLTIRKCLWGLGWGVCVGVCVGVWGGVWVCEGGWGEDGISGVGGKMS